MALREPDTTLGPFRERDTPLLTAVVKDNENAVIPGVDLVSITMTLYSEKKPYAIINGRDHLDLQPFVSSTGVLSFQLTQEDMAIVDGKLTENHRALIEWIWGADLRGSHEIRIIVSNEEKVPLV